MNIYEKLLAIQTELKAPKGQYNSFGKYSYRSCEDILEAVKPLCEKNKVVLQLSDKLDYTGNRYYIKATATLTDTEGNQEYIVNTAYAREEEVKKGMDGSQITGTASSYARKYALNGLFCIDDTKDADTDEFGKIIGKDKKEEDITINQTQENTLRAIIKDRDIEDEVVIALLKSHSYKKLADIKVKDFVMICEELKS